jgi:tRNA nucleotidyltransferase (CCA-adding enzyme)
MTSLILSDFYKIRMNQRDYSIAYFENTAQHLLKNDPRFQVTIEDMLLVERAREDLFKHLRHTLGKQFQMSLEVYGSAATGLYTCGSSDVDMTLILS